MTIKPGTLCMIRNVPKDYPGYSCNGKIITAVAIKRVSPEGNVWEIEPALQEGNRVYYGCAERWLHPLDDFEDELAREALDQVLERTFRESLAKELDKIK